MRLRIFSGKGSWLHKSPRSSWLEIAILAMLAAAILRLGGDITSQWRLTAERIGLVEANLHAKGLADYSADPLEAIIPPISPAILKDLLGLISPPWETPANPSGGNLDLPVSPTDPGPAVTASTPTQTSTSQVPDETYQPTDIFTPTETPPGIVSPTPTRTSTQIGIATPTSTRIILVTLTPTRTPTPRISPTRTATQAISPTPPTPTKTLSPDTPTPKPDTPTPKPDTPTLKPDTPTLKPDTPTLKPDTPTPKPDTPTPKPKTPTPFVTRDPTQALTPTGNYTPGGTSAPVTMEPPKKAAGEIPICGFAAGQIQPEGSCLMETGPGERSSERSLWQTLLDFFTLHLDGGLLFRVSG